MFAITSHARDLTVAGILAGSALLAALGFIALPGVGDVAGGPSTVQARHGADDAPDAPDDGKQGADDAPDAPDDNGNDGANHT